MHLDLGRLRGEINRIRKVVIRAFRAAHRFTLRTLREHGIKMSDLRREAIEAIAIIGLAATTLAAPVLAAGAPTAPPAVEKSPAPISAAELQGPPISYASKNVQFTSQINEAVPSPGPNLQADQELALEQLISTTYGVPAKAQLDGIRLNTVFGVMAGEQHLPLYPGDSLENHKSDPTRNLTGMVPGLPSWGYFAKSKSEVTQKDIENERYYIAAQTFLAPGFRENVEKYYKWFQYRKMVVVNAETGSACVVDIADAGPSPFLKRSFGGSNEVLMSLDLGLSRKGAVYALFLDDPEDKIPLGPLTEH